MACYLLAALRWWFHCCKIVGSGAAGLQSPPLGIGLAAIYLVPAAWEQRWVDVRQATDDPGEMIENSWLFAATPTPRSSCTMELTRSPSSPFA
jgi:hypothetical protein